MVSIEITAAFAALLAIIQIAFTLRVVLCRRANKISLGDGANSELLKRMRAHANFTETVPIALILLLLNELNGANSGLLYALGALLLISRITHYLGVANSQFGLRTWGMIGTITMIFSSAIALFI